MSLSLRTSLKINMQLTTQKLSKMVKKGEKSICFLASVEKNIQLIYFLHTTICSMKVGQKIRASLPMFISAFISPSRNTLGKNLHFVAKPSLDMDQNCKC